MTKITIDKALIEQAIADLEHISTAAGQVEFIDGTCQKLREALAEPAPEPVAWSMTYNGNHCGNFYKSRTDAEERMADMNAKHPLDKRAIEPLYAAPVREPAPQPPADGPMIEPIPPEKITDHMRGMDDDMLEDLCLFSFSSGVRWAEKQHGIGGG